MSLDKNHEHILIERLKVGDHGAINEIVDNYKGPLFAFILRMVENHSDAEDMFQETWIKVIKHINRFRGESKFSTWLFQIAVNLCRDYGRKKKKGVHVPIDDFNNSLSQESGIDPYSIIRNKLVKKIVNSLPAKMKETVLLKYFHDLSEYEISEVLGCPAGTVKSRLHRASKIIRKKWDFSESSY